MWTTDKLAEQAMRLLSGREWALAAKTDPVDQSLWLPLIIHLMDTAAAMAYLVTQWLPPGYGETLGLGGTLFYWMAIAAALLHDVGKATPIFQRKITGQRPELQQLLQAQGLDAAQQSGTREISIPHAAAGAELLRKTGLSEGLAAVVGAHHGKPESRRNGDPFCKDSPKSFGWSGVDAYDTPWGETQRTLIRWALAQVEEPLPDCSLAAQMVLSGLVIMADWIASNTAYFPLVPADEPLRAYDPRRAAEALQKLNLPRPWQVSEAWRETRFFQQRFGFAANSVQKQAEQIAAAMPAPGVMIIEAPMGHGKTEAALAAAEILMNRFHLGGAAFFLPSQATSNAMYSRMTRWAAHQPDAIRVAVELIHGQAEFNEEFRALEEGRVLASQGEADALTVHSFFRGRKTRLLANLVVGTVDQLLMAALKQKHVMLRQLGLTGKVIIIDECHAYDAYMNTYLDRVLDWLGVYQVPVILLSATLPGERRAELLKAYSGQGKTVPEVAASQAYPLLSWTEGERIRLCPVAPEGDSRVVRVQRVEEAQALAAAEQALREGCVGVIVNTVARAQRLQEVFRSRCPDAVILVDHSQFLAPDRQAHEAEIMARVGKHSTAQTRRGVLVIGTQVLEQSLDLDFDRIITDLCPMDLLLQRIGRLHRHTRKRPCGLEQPECLVLGAQGELDDGSEAVYGAYLLLRTRALLPETIRLPEDISPLVQKAYDKALWTPEADAAYDAAREAYRLEQSKKKKKGNAQAYLLDRPGRDGFKDSLVGLLDSDQQFTELQAQAAVRDGTAAIEVLVVQQAGEGMMQLLSGPQRGARYRADTQPSSEESRAIAAQRLRLPSHFGKKNCVDEVIETLERQTGQWLPLWTQAPMLTGELFLILDPEGTATLAGKRMRYDAQVGLTEIKREEAHGN